VPPDSELLAENCSAEMRFYCRRTDSAGRGSVETPISPQSASGHSQTEHHCSSTQIYKGKIQTHINNLSFIISNWQVHSKITRYGSKGW